MPTVTTAQQYRMIKNLEDLADRVGFQVNSSNTGWDSSGIDLYLTPYEDRLPIYAKDAVLAKGTVEELICWLIGWQKSLEYLTFLGACDKKKIQRREQDYRNKRLAQLIKNGKKDDDQSESF